METELGWLSQRCHVEQSETSLISSMVCGTTTIRCTSSATNAALHCYIGITNDIVRRLSQHRRGEVDGFTKCYQLNRLVWIEHFRDVRDAIACEKKLKGWRRSKKIALVEQANPKWIDLSDDWEQQPKLYDRPWNIEEMIEDSSPATAGSE